MNSDSNLLMFQQFDHLRNQILLWQQDQLAELEMKLNDLNIKSTNNHKILLKSQQQDNNKKISEHLKLLATIEAKLIEYDNIPNSVRMLMLTSCEVLYSVQSVNS